MAKVKSKIVKDVEAEEKVKKNEEIEETEEVEKIEEVKELEEDDLEETKEDEDYKEVDKKAKKEEKADKKKNKKDGYFKTVSKELKKVVWPTGGSIAKYSLAVIILCLFFCAFFLGVDLLASILKDWFSSVL